MQDGHFHIHIDAETVTPAFEAMCKALGFLRADFERVEGAESYAPKHHLTLKPQGAGRFKRAFDNAAATAAREGIRGYIEGEFLPLDERIDERAFDPTIRQPFRLNLGPLEPGSFRETEIHVTLDRDRSDQRLRKLLEDTGMYWALMKKAYGTAQIFTAQGFRREIDQIGQALRQYLARAGGGVECSIKEERIARSWVSGSDVRLPPIVRSIEWL